MLNKSTSLLKKSFFPFLLCFIMLSNSVSAAGWNYDLSVGEHWGSDPCTTGYPHLVWDINQTVGGYGSYKIQRVSNGSWVDVKSFTLSGYNQKISVTVNPVNSTDRFRVFVDVGWSNLFSGPGGVSGSVSCRGSW